MSRAIPGVIAPVIVRSSHCRIGAVHVVITTVPGRRGMRL